MWERKKEKVNEENCGGRFFHSDVEKIIIRAEFRLQIQIEKEETKKKSHNSNISPQQ